MTVGELIKELANQDLEADVFLSSDEEGNSFHNIAAVEADDNFIVLWPDHTNLEF